MSDNKIWFLDYDPKIEVRDQSREACIIYIDKYGKEEYREYFGNNPRLEYPNER